MKWTEAFIRPESAGVAGGLWNGQFTLSVLDSNGKQVAAVAGARIAP